jgi:hypothetical protein
MRRGFIAGRRALKFLLALSIAGCAIAGSTVVGVVVDVSGYPVDTLIRLTPKDSTKAKFETRTDRKGAFAIQDVAPGDYTMLVDPRGFQNERLDVHVLDGEPSVVGNIVLKLPSCDAPGVICDTFGIDDAPPPPGYGDVELQRGCAIDLDKRNPRCETGSTTDIRFDEEDGKLYFTFVNGATLCGTGEKRIRIDGLLRGDDFCVATPEQHRSHVYISSEEVQPRDREVEIHFRTEWSPIK